MAIAPSILFPHRATEMLAEFDAILARWILHVAA